MYDLVKLIGPLLGILGPIVAGIIGYLWKRNQAAIDERSEGQDRRMNQIEAQLHRMREDADDYERETLRRFVGLDERYPSREVMEIHLSNINLQLAEIKEMLKGRSTTTY